MIQTPSLPNDLRENDVHADAQIIQRSLRLVTENTMPPVRRSRVGKPAAVIRDHDMILNDEVAGSILTQFDIFESVMNLKISVGNLQWNSALYGLSSLIGSTKFPNLETISLEFSWTGHIVGNALQFRLVPVSQARPASRITTVKVTAGKTPQAMGTMRYRDGLCKAIGNALAGTKKTILTFILTLDVHYPVEQCTQSSANWWDFPNLKRLELGRMDSGSKSGFILLTEWLHWRIWEDLYELRICVPLGLSEFEAKDVIIHPSGTKNDCLFTQHGLTVRYVNLRLMTLYTVSIL